MPMRDMPAAAARPWRIDERTAFRAAVLIYLVTTAWGVLNDGFHSDDWRHVNGTSPLWTAIEGRWLLEVIFRDLFGERFLLPVQVTLAFPCFWWVARTVAAHAAPEAARPAATLAIFAVSVNHIYMADTLSFESNVFAYPFALALSVGAFELLWRVAGKGRGAQALAILAAGQLLAFSLAIYQTFAEAGLIIPVLALLRIDRVRFAAAVRIAAVGALATAIAVVLYFAEWHAYAALRGIEIAAQRFQTTDAAGFAEKISALPAVLRSLHTGTLMHVPRVLRVTLGLFALGALALLALGWLNHGKGARVLSAFRLAIGAGLAFFVFPILFWLGYETYWPPGRAFAYLGSWIPAVAIAGLTLASGPARWRRGLVAAGAAAIALVALVFALTASAFWSDSARLGARDADLARAIRAKLATLEGFVGPPFRLVGSVDYPDLSWGSLAGWSSFHAGNPNIGIFRALFGDTVETGVLPASPRACRAFPAEDSAYLHDGIAYLCLEDRRPFVEEMSCAPLSAGGAICLGPKVFAHVAPACLETERGGPEMRVAFHFEGRSFAPERSFTGGSDAVRMEDGCYTLALAPNPKGLKSITVRLAGPDGATLWDEDVNLAALRPPRKP
jgi:hypothetical protein